MLLNALDAAIRQAGDKGATTDILVLATKEAQLQGARNAKADPSDISRQATKLLAALYAPETLPPTPSVPDPPPLANWRLNGFVMFAIAAALMLPLICVAAFWWGAKVTQDSVRKGFREAGLL